MQLLSHTELGFGWPAGCAGCWIRKGGALYHPSSILRLNPFKYSEGDPSKESSYRMPAGHNHRMSWYVVHQSWPVQPGWWAGLSQVVYRMHRPSVSSA